MQIILAHPSDEDNLRRPLREHKDLIRPPIWPLHPQPRPFEPLSLWLERVAREYGVRYRTFCRYGLGLDHETINLMCHHPPEATLAKISAGTGVPLSRLREMTIGSLISQLQAELGVAIAGYKPASVVEWLTAKVFISDRSDPEYWETIESWSREKEFKARRHSTDFNTHRVLPSKL